MRRTLYFSGALGAAALWTLAPDPAWTQETPIRFVVDTVEDTPDISPGDGVCADADGKCSLRAAVQEANALETPVEIVLSGDGIYRLEIPGSNEDESATGDLDVLGSISVAGSGALVLGDDLDRVFDVHVGASLTLADIRLGDGRVTGEQGGAIRSRGALHVDRTEVFRGFAVGDSASAGVGGGLFNDGGEAELRDSEFKTCRANFGGAVAARGGTTTIVNCQFKGNGGIVGVDGGAVHAADDTDILLTGCYFVVNEATRGGALSNGTGTMTVDRCTIFENHAWGDLDGEGGGGAFNAGGTLSVTRSRISDNDALGARGDGGGILNVGGRVELTRSAVVGNIGFRDGGGIATVSGAVAATRCRIARNVAFYTFRTEMGSGGGIHVAGAAGVTLERCHLGRNYAYGDGGAVWNGGSGSVRIAGSRIVGNVANHFAMQLLFEGDPFHPAGHGGAIAHHGTQLEVERCRFAGNRAVGHEGLGGAVHSAGTGLSVRLSVVTGNSAKRSGGGLELDDGSETVLDRVSVVGNAAVGSEGVGGGIRLRDAATLTMMRGRLVANRARSQGGGLWLSEAGAATLERTLLGGNRARTGSQVFNDGGSLTITRRAAE